jgi:hypothetical protein
MPAMLLFYILEGRPPNEIGTRSINKLDYWEAMIDIIFVIL